MNKKIAVVMIITGAIMVVMSIVLNDSVAASFTVFACGIAFFSGDKEIKKRQKYIYEESEAEHKILYDEMMLIKSEYDMVNQQNQEKTKVIKIVCYSITIVLIIVGVYMSYTSPTGLLHKSIGLVTVLLLVWTILMIVFFLLNIGNTEVALNKIEYKMYNLCMDSNSDEVNVQKLRDYRVKLERRSFLSKKVEKVRISTV